MSKVLVKRSTCRVCQSPRVASAVPFVATPPGDMYIGKDQLDKNQEEFPLELFMCEACGSLQLLHVVNPEFLYAKQGHYLYQTSVSLGLPEHFRRYAEEIVQFAGAPQGSLFIDIGCNDGTLLKCFQEQGMNVVGIDPAMAAVQTARSRGIDTRQAFFDHAMAKELKKELGAIAVVTANNMMANIEPLDDFAEGIRELLGEDGYFVFETGYGLDLIERALIDVVYHGHLSYFAVKPLAAFLERHGMRMVDARWIPSKGGSIRCVAQPLCCARPVMPSVREMIDFENARGLGTLGHAQKLYAFIRQRREELVELLERLRSENNVVAGYGASEGVTTLLYLFGLDKYLDFLVDDNPVRCGLFSPGQHVPVYSSDVLYEKKPDHVLILSWRYTEPIMKKHLKYVEQGGKFIAMLPDLKIL